MYSANPAASYSRRLTKAHELQRTRHLFSGTANCAHGRVRSLPVDECRTTDERYFQVPARDPHGPVVTKFYCPAPYFYLPRDVGTCLSLSHASVMET